MTRDLTFLGESGDEGTRVLAQDERMGSKIKRKEVDAGKRYSATIKVTLDRAPGGFPQREQGENKGGNRRETKKKDKSPCT